jgi:hypothetical protein
VTKSLHAELIRNLFFAILCAGLASACQQGQPYKGKDASADTASESKADAPVDAPASADADADTDAASVDLAADVPTTPTCTADEHLCSGACVSSDDPKSCGTSCTRCADPVGGTATCVARACDGACPGTKKLCHGTCIDMTAACDGACPMGTHACGNLCSSDEEVNSCGTSCAACAVPAHALAATCDGTKCDFTCATGLHKCAADCARDDDATACGAACVACPTGANGSPLCASGTCTLACASGFHLCNGKCVSSTDVATCGTSCTACNVPTGGSATCASGACGTACPTNQKVCNGVCIAMTAACSGACDLGSHACSGFCDANTSVNSCGTTACTSCPLPTGASQASCDGTKCSFSCGQGYHTCGAGCSADSDATACGTGCVKCPTDPKGTAICTSGTCGISCAQGYHQCPPGTGTCVANTLLTSCGPTSCSACAVPTGGSATCDGLSCGTSCPGGTQLCNGACIASNLACNNMCPASTHNCSGICSPNGNVGTCGSRCSACADPTSHGAASCNGTSCGIACDGGYRNCAGTNLCVAMAAPACCTSADCTAGATGTIGVCNNNVCSYPCNTPTYKTCGSACIPAASCCTSSDCSGSKPVCSGGTCVARPNGQACVGGDCASGNCIDGVCCDLACAGQCQACDVSGSVGTCTPVTGTPHRTATPARPLCGGDPACPGQCNGATTAKCAYPANTCRGQTCSSKIQVNAAVCDANGVCPAATTVSCTYTCVGAACGGVCNPGDTRCSGNTPQTCDGTGTWQGTTACSGTTPKCDPNTHVCVKSSNGDSCSSGTSCSTGNCVGGVCCGAACNGPCNTGTCATGTCAIKPAKTFCGYKAGPSGPGIGTDVAQYCDGTGACVAPTITCTGFNPVSCPLANNACCVISGSSSYVCVAPSSCLTPNDGDFFSGFACITGADCPTNYDCCNQPTINNSTGFWSSCVPTGTCTGSVQ